MIETLEQILTVGWVLFCLIFLGWNIGRYIQLKLKNL